MILVGILMYFGAILVPIVYLVTTGWSGRAKKMLIGVGLQLFWSLIVWGFVWYSWRNGYSEFYWGWALLIPVNIVALIWYLGCLLWPKDKRPNQSLQPTAPSGRG
jgi:hypothetical protein